MALIGASAPPVLPAQTPDTARTVTLPAVTISVTRAELPAEWLPFDVTTVDARTVLRARPTWGLDEALGAVPSVFVANRYNFSLDQRIAIRGFGARSAFAVRGVKVLLDGIPQTLPDGQGQLTNVDLATVERVEVLSGAASALHGNAAGGVISIWTGTAAPATWTYDLRVSAGGFDRRLDRKWSKWQVATAARVGQGSLRLSASRLTYEGERDFSAADLRNYGGRLSVPVAPGWTVTAAADFGDQPEAQNPGSLTASELSADRDQAAPANLAQHAGKAVRQGQAGLTVRRQFRGGGELAMVAFGLTRDLVNPQTFAWIELDRRVWGARMTLSRGFALGGLTPHVAAGFDLQFQRDDRVNYPNNGGVRDSVRTLDQRERVGEAGVFVQTTVPLSEAVGVTAGARYDRVRFRVADRLVTGANPDDSGDRLLHAPSGSLGVTWRAHPRATLYANAGTAFETPTTTELANRPSGAGGFNDSLGPQRAWMLEAGVRWTAGAVRGTIATFRGDVRDALVPYEVPAAPQRRFFRNAGRALHTGVEASIEARARAWLLVRGAYAWSRFRYGDYELATPSGVVSLDGRPLPGIPPHHARITVELRPAGAFWADAELTSTARVPVHDTLDTRAAGWMTVDLRAGWNGLVGSAHIRAFAGLMNAFDRHYVGSVVGNAAGGRFYEPAPGRHMLLGLEIGGGR